MKKSLYFILLSLLAFASCSKDERENRLTEKVIALPDDDDDDPFKQYVLIEDFTGQRCVNCPSAAELIHGVSETFGESVIPVGIHGGSFGQNTPLANALGSLGSYCYDQWGGNSLPQPSVLVNRRPGGMLSNVSEIESKLFDNVRAETQKKSTVGFKQVEIATKIGSDSYTISFELIAKEGIPSANLQLWVVEDGIDSYQFYSDGRHNYTHNHVLRGSITENLGDVISLSKTDPLQKQYTYTHNAAWNLDNVSIVAIVSSPDKGVLQVHKIKL